MMLYVSYDESVMQLKDAENGDALKNLLNFTKPGQFAPQYRFVWDGQQISEGDIHDGTILVLHFDILNTAKSGVYPIHLSYNEKDIIDNNLSPLLIKIENGNITIQN